MDEQEEVKPGLPAYMGTFADLMSLLMCFFVLLLSFAEMDATKFKQIAQSLEKAFGVQREVPAISPPMGTSPIFDKFSPGKPEPTVLDQVKQQTSNDDPKLRTHTAEAQKSVEQQVDALAAEVARQLSKELEQGSMQLEKGNRKLVIRIEERGSFGSGSSELARSFVPAVERIGAALAKLPGEISIEGHTDNIPIRTARFQSNWDLSASRAASVANALLDAGAITSDRLRLQGYAETRPRVDNSTPENRAQNRRVEIIVDLNEPAREYEAEFLRLMQAGQVQDAAQLTLTR